MTKVSMRLITHIWRFFKRVFQGPSAPVCILGINHQIQSTTIASASTGGSAEAFERRQKEQYDMLLQQIIDKHRVEFVGEEFQHGWESIAKAVALGRKCHYENIEMPPEERTAKGIPPDYETKPAYTQIQIAQFHEQREAYMHEKTENEAGDAKSILVICGRYHVARLAAKFQAAGHNVEMTDLQNEPWYIEDWATHIMGL